MPSSKARQQSPDGRKLRAARVKRYRESAKGRATEARYNEANAEKMAAYNAEWSRVNTPRLQKAKRAWLDDFKRGPCLDCGKSYPPVVMDFDHVRGAKVAGVSSMLRRCAYDAIVAEIAKCDLVCANCHRLRTFKRASK
jgi:hypothetical protein